MHITRFVTNMVQENCYLVWDETQEAALIDCGALYDEEKQAICGFIEDNHLQLKHLFNTHAHFDHLFGAQFVYDTYGAGVELCADEKNTYEHAAEQMQQFLHVDLPLSLPPVARYFSHGDELSFGHTHLQVIATPGHTPGGVCFYNEAEAVLFSGDSLFKHAIGRCDFPGGDEVMLVKALKERVLTLPNGVKVLPGHGDFTTISEEKQMNGWLI